MLVRFPIYFFGLPKGLIGNINWTRFRRHASSYVASCVLVHLPAAWTRWLQPPLVPVELVERPGRCWYGWLMYCDASSLLLQHSRLLCDVRASIQPCRTGHGSKAGNTAEGACRTQVVRARKCSTRRNLIRRPLSALGLIRFLAFSWGNLRRLLLLQACAIVPMA